jgi:uncharacterized protein YwqG
MRRMWFQLNDSTRSAACGASSSSITYPDWAALSCGHYLEFGFARSRRIIEMEDLTMEKKPLMEILEIMGLHRVLKILNESEETCLGFRTIPTDEEPLAIGSSKVGGKPDLPSSLPWPVGNDKCLDFVAQINLAEIPGNLQNDLLPKSGMLYVFYNAESGAWGFCPADNVHWRVLFFQGDRDALVRTRKPGPIERATYRPCGVEFYESLCPDWHEVRNHPALNEHADEVARFDNFVTMVFNKVPVHQIMGDPHGIQSSPEDMQRKCQFVSHGLYMGGSGGPPFDEAEAIQLEPGAKEWRLLLQLDSDSDPGMQWGDRGRLYFWIREQDLAAKNFNAVWMILECF